MNHSEDLGGRDELPEVVGTDLMWELLATFALLFHICVKLKDLVHKTDLSVPLIAQFIHKIKLLVLFLGCAIVVNTQIIKF